MRNLVLVISRSFCRNALLKRTAPIATTITRLTITANQSQQLSLSKVMDAKLGDMRKPYRSADSGFDVDSLVPTHNPFDQFEAWMKEAMACKQILEPNAMAVATASHDGQPSVRMILLKHYDANGFVFFTSFGSRKGKDLEKNKQASFLFYWEPLHRQIRIEGLIDQLSAEDSDAYWSRRPYGSQISASSGLVQSSVIPNKEILNEKIKEAGEKYPPPGPVPRPREWGGYRLNARVFEFWQGQTSRNHDRLRFSLDENGVWKIERLAP